MLEDLLNLRHRFAIARHREAPLLKEREKFLEHLYRLGTSLAALRSISWQLLNIIAQLKLTQLRQISIGEIEDAGRAWQVQQWLPHVSILRHGKAIPLVQPPCAHRAPTPRRQVLSQDVAHNFSCLAHNKSMLPAQPAASRLARS